MAFSPLATMTRRIPDGGRSSIRQAALIGHVIHHNAGVDAYTEATNPAREVSANYWIINAGILLPNVDETRRAWTSGMPGYPAGAQADHRSLTWEISNTPAGVKNRTWEISTAAMDMWIAAAGETSARLGMGPIVRSAVKMVGVHKDYVNTSCPGPYVMAQLAHMIAEAEKERRRLLAGSKPGKAPSVPILTPPAPRPVEWPHVALLLDEYFGPVSTRAYQRLLAGIDLYAGLIDGIFAGMTARAEQRWLTSLGYYKGNIDGWRGPMTITALQTFLKAKGLYAGLIDGYFGPMTVLALQAYINSQATYYR